ncbi:MAG: SDR family oxidoreductase [Bacteroidetes bacterium]|nr:SDR family oxidoreductase [Bacteroidota bacterium]
MNTILVAGASGVLGRLVVQQLLQRGVSVRVLSRTVARASSAGTNDRLTQVIADLTRPASLTGACHSVDAVISCAGASMNMKAMGDRTSFTAVDLHGNDALLQEAKRSGVRKFVYVSVAGEGPYEATEYVRAHRQFEERLAASGIAYSVVRPAGFYAFLAEIFAMARQGRGFIIGDGSNRTNPVHEREVALACVAALERSESMIQAGGPEIFTRRQIVELAFRVAGRTPSIISVPPALFSVMTSPLRLINPRIHALLDFGKAVSTADAVVPVYGTERLEGYFTALRDGSAV